MAKEKKPRGPKKKDLVQDFVLSLTFEQRNLISKLRGIPFPDTVSKQCNVITRLFKKTISMAYRKGKARELQNYAAQQISEITGLPCGKDEEIEPRQMGQAGVDIRLGFLARSLFPWSGECKNAENFDIPGAIEQAKANAYPDTNWFVLMERQSQREDRKVAPIVILDADVFFGLFKKPKVYKRKK